MEQGKQALAFPLTQQSMWRGVGGARSSRACGEMLGVPCQGVGGARSSRACGEASGVPGQGVGGARSSRACGEVSGVPVQQSMWRGIGGARSSRACGEASGVPGPAERVERRRGGPAAASSLKHITGCGVWSLGQGAFKLLTI